MTEIRVPLCDTLTDLGLLIDKNPSIPCLLPPCFIQNLPSYSFGMIPSLHWPYKNNFLGVDLFPSFPAGRNRYGLLIFTSWGKKPNTQRLSLLVADCNCHQICPEIGLDWYHPFGAANTTKNVLQTETFWSHEQHLSGCAHNSHTREVCAAPGGTDVFLRGYTGISSPFSRFSNTRENGHFGNTNLV